MLENPQELPKMVEESAARPSEYVAPESAKDLCARVTPYAEAWAKVADELWHEMYPTGQKTYADKMSQTDVDEKAKIIAEEDKKTEAIVA